VLLVDDLISTGGTLVALVQAVRQAGGEVVELFTIGEKLENDGRRRLRERTGLPLKTLLASDMAHGPDGVRSRVRHVHLGRLDEDTFQRVAAHFPPGFCRLGSGEAPSSAHCS
jgi:adenine phosphoribosyltransferase